MATYRGEQTLVLRENGKWLRYVFWGGALGMCFLVVSAIDSPVPDVGKIIGSAMGILFFGFSGCVLQTRRIVVDPSRREITIASEGFRQATTERLRFDEIKRILVLTTFDSVENLRGVSIMRERWSIAFVLKERSVPVTKNLYITKEQALRDAQKIQRLLDVEISDTVEESIAHLAQNGKRVEAMTLASRALGQTTAQAKEFVERNAGLTGADEGDTRLSNSQGLREMELAAGTVGGETSIPRRAKSEGS
jgi:hypothetical protein